MSQIHPLTTTAFDLPGYRVTKSFGVVIEVPGRPGHYCAAVDKALELKLKRAQSVSRQP